MPDNPAWGGKRSGSGRPLKGQSPRRRVSYALPTDQIASIEALAMVLNLNKSEALSWLITQGLSALSDDLAAQVAGRSEEPI